MDKIKLNAKSSESYLNELRNDKNLEGLDVNINNCNLLSRYLTELEQCRECKGLEYCKNDPSGYKSKITQTGSFTNVAKYPCDFKKEQQKKEEVKGRFKTLFMPKTIEEASFDYYNLNSVERQKYYKYINSFCINYKSGEPAKGLFVCGNFQIGKTYSLACAANLFAKNNIDTLLIYFPDLVRELKSLLNKPEFEERINMLKSIDVLMLDDIGAEMPSAWVRDEILCPIINYRLQEHLPVFFSTNYTIEGLKDFYSRPDGSNNSADRLIARIKALATFIEFK